MKFVVKTVLFVIHPQILVGFLLRYQSYLDDQKEVKKEARVLVTSYKRPLQCLKNILILCVVNESFRCEKCCLLTLVFSA